MPKSPGGWRLFDQLSYVVDFRWWPETGSNRRPRPFQAPLPMDLSGLESAEVIETKRQNGEDS
jgi:hypothetical protein